MLADDSGYMVRCAYPSPAGLTMPTTISPRTAAAKVRKRGASTTRALQVMCDLRAVPELAPGDLTIVAVAPDDSDPLVDVLEQRDDRDYLFVRALERTRRARAGELVLGRIEDTVVAAHFVHRLRDYERLESVAPGLYPRLPPDAMLTEAVYVAPSWRGHSLGPRMLAATCRRLGSEGARRALAYVDVTNRSSLRAFRSAGYDRTDEMRLDRYLLGTRRSRFVASDEQAVNIWSRNVRGVAQAPPG